MSPDPIAAPPHHGPGAPTAMAQFMDLMADDPYQAPTLACFPEQAAHSRTVALVELHDPNPVDSIMGMALGELFAAVAFCGSGRARPLPGCTYPVADGEEMRMMHGVAVDGSWESLYWHAALGGTRCSGTAADPVAGHIDDLLRRALDLPTAPPTVSTAHLWASMWCRLVECAVDACDEPLDWDTVVRLHPAIIDGVDEPVDLERTIDHDQVVTAAAAYAERVDWSRVRATAQVNADANPVGAPPHDRHATWLDDGAYSRYVLEERPPLGQHVDRIAATAARRWDGRPAQRLRADLLAMIEAFGLDPWHDPRVPGC